MLVLLQFDSPSLQVVEAMLAAGRLPALAGLRDRSDVIEDQAGAERLHQVGFEAVRHLGDKAGPDPGLDGLEGWMLWRNGKLDEALFSSLKKAGTLAEIEDIWLPFKKKKKTRGMLALERGLEPLADIMLSGSDAEVEDAARRANAHEFIEKLPLGYGTFIGERGVKLSGGQCQRLAIARAILKHPQILILDEATSTLDTESEQLIQASMAGLLAGRTTFVIAHRLSTIRRADLILLMEHGAVVERGTHEALMQQQGLYHEMVKRQEAGQEQF